MSKIIAAHVLEWKPFWVRRRLQSEDYRYADLTKSRPDLPSSKEQTALPAWLLKLPIASIIGPTAGNAIAVVIAADSTVTLTAKSVGLYNFAYQWVATVAAAVGVSLVYFSLATYYRLRDRMAAVVPSKSAQQKLLESADNDKSTRTGLYSYASLLLAFLTLSLSAALFVWLPRRYSELHRSEVRAKLYKLVDDGVLGLSVVPPKNKKGAVRKLRIDINTAGLRPLSSWRCPELQGSEVPRIRWEMLLPKNVGVEYRVRDSESPWEPVAKTKMQAGDVELPHAKDTPIPPDVGVWHYGYQTRGFKGWRDPVPTLELWIPFRDGAEDDADYRELVGSTIVLTATTRTGCAISIEKPIWALLGRNEFRHTLSVAKPIVLEG